MTTPEEDLADRVRAAVARHRDVRGPLLPVLHELLAADGWLDPAAVPMVAAELNLSRAEVHGVVTFYSDFRTTPPGRRTVRVCIAEACQAVGSRDLVVHATARLGVSLEATTPDGEVTLEPVACLGNCALGPSVMVDGMVHGRVDAGRFDELVAEPDR